MRVVVTGSSGFIGRYVVARLATETIDVYAVSCRYSNAADTSNVQHFSGDLRDPHFADAVTKSADVVIHLAGLAHARFAADDYGQVNVKATQNVAEAAIRNGVSSFVFASSISVYGPCRDGTVSEASSCHPATDYGRSKLQAEDVLTSLSGGSPMSVLILRLSTVYGAGDPGNMSRLIKSVQRFGPIVVGRGTNLKSLIHVGNVAELMVSLIGRELPHLDVVNVGDPAPYSLSTIVGTVADVTGDRRPMVRVPQSLAAAGAGFIELLWAPTGRKSPISRDQVAKLTESAVVDVTHLSDAYGFTSRILLREGIQRTLGLLA